MYIGIFLALISFSVSGADTYSIQHDVEVFFSSGLGIVVLIFLMLLFLLWILLPFAVFGLKSKLKDIIWENRETNKILSDIRDELATLKSDDSMDTDTELPRVVVDKSSEDRI
jgi:hypothetical protein